VEGNCKKEKAWGFLRLVVGTRECIKNKKQKKKKKKKKELLGISIWLEVF